MWIAEIQTAHAIQPLLAHDGRNLEVALERFGEDSTWLHPPKEEEGEEQEEETTSDWDYPITEGMVEEGALRVGH